MYIRFTHNRLLVGYRGKDWTEIWYEPDVDKNEEGEAETLLYKLTIGKAGYREPREDEVRWLPQFDKKTFESDTPTGRVHMQKQFLTDAHVYLSEKDPARIMELELELDTDQSPRWQTWFKAAKKFKKTQMQARLRRRQKRTQQARNQGQTEAQIEKDIDSDSSDSAYDTDEERGKASVTGSSAIMPPPRRATKRKFQNGTNSGTNGGSKRPKSSNLPYPFSRLLSGSPRMSGGLGPRSESVAQSTRTSNEDDEYVVSNQGTGLLGLNSGWGFDNITPPSSGLAQGRRGDLTGVRSSARANQQIGNGVNLRRQLSHDSNSEDEEQVDNDPQEERLRDLNGGMTEEEAIDSALRASMEPTAHHNENHIIKSIEEDVDDTQAEQE